MSNGSLFEAIREIHLHRRTGVLVVERQEGLRRLYFRRGELHLVASHPLAMQVRELLKARPGAADKSDLRELVTLTERLADALASWTGKRRFVALEAEIPHDLVGPLPTDRLLMHALTSGLQEAELIERLGGVEAVLAAADGLRRAAESTVPLEPREAYLLSRLEEPVRIADLLALPSLSRADTVVGLSRLHAAGLVERREPSPARPDDFLPQELLERFLARVRRALAERPLGIGLEAHREELRTLLALPAEVDHYELLQVSRTASESDVYKAFSHLARRVHPSHAERLGLEERRDDLHRLFRRLTEAYLTLSDPDRRASYGSGPAAPHAMAERPAPQRHEERRSFARKQFELATAHAEMLDFHVAVQLLQQAVDADPRADYFALLAECQAQNPRWLDRAAISYRRAIELRPEDPELRVALAQVAEKLGRFEEARQSYEAALHHAPGHLGARLGMDDLRRQLRQGRSGWRERLRRLFGG